VKDHVDVRVNVEGFSHVVGLEPEALDSGEIGEVVTTARQQRV
jgi:hypothetical protein